MSRIASRRERRRSPCPLFTIDYDGKIYVVTARHVIKELGADNATIQFRGQDDNWNDFHPVRIFLPPSDEADIAVLETNETVSQPFAVTIPMENENAANMGNRCGSWDIPSQACAPAQVASGCHSSREAQCRRLTTRILMRLCYISMDLTILDSLEDQFFSGITTVENLKSSE